MIGVELTTGAKLVVLAARDRNSQYAARLAFRWLDRPLIVLPRMARAFSGGRDGTPEAEAPDALQQEIEGQVIRGVRPLPMSRACGERMEIEFANAGRLHLEAMVMERSSDGLLADLGYVFMRPDRTRIVMP